MADLRPWIKIEGNTLFVFDKNGDDILYSVNISDYALNLFAKSVLSDVEERKKKVGWGKTYRFHFTPI